MCSAEARKRQEFKDEPYPGEYVKYIGGWASGNNIKSGEPCIAYSIYTDRTPYYEWEGEFIDLAKMKEGG
jgi:hypothetical protein